MVTCDDIVHTITCKTYKKSSSLPLKFAKALLGALLPVSDRVKQEYYSHVFF